MILIRSVYFTGPRVIDLILINGSPLFRIKSITRVLDSGSLRWSKAHIRSHIMMIWPRTWVLVNKHIIIFARDCFNPLYYIHYYDSRSLELNLLHVPRYVLIITSRLYHPQSWLKTTTFVYWFLNSRLWNVLFVQSVVIHSPWLHRG